MDSFVAYSDSDSQSEEGQEGPPPQGAGAADAVPPAFRPAWQQSDDEESDDEENDDPKLVQQAGNPKRGSPEASEAVSEPKKRKLMDPFAAMSQASKSFLSADQSKNEDVQYFAARSKEDEATGGSKQSQKEGSTEDGRALALAASPLLSAPPAAAKSTRKEETTRQKNARKQKMGQATFTAKSNRDCPDIWQGAS